MRVKGIRNGPTLHSRVNLAESKHDSHGWTTRLCLFNKLDHNLK
ncbi:Chorismate synthase [Gossypium arboreum]|uniref:Chorismate synthase n=1 Tax=Gossypium arboreum TaxID=29729 RepID=A0A0B0NU99_GOSAR|nr:Chorismate synthase [Gossypium arboreum]KHG16330.1 Chorismate synthase [Gossypium arboreum]